MEIKREQAGDKDLVWAQIRYCPYWPARIVETPPTLAPAPSNKICVLFFGTKQFGFVNRDKVLNYIENREKFVKKGKGHDFRTAVQQMDEYVSDNVKFRSHACVKPVKVVVKTERNVEKQLGIIKTEKTNKLRSQCDVNTAAAGASQWAKEKQDLIDKIIKLKSENQIMTQDLNEKHAELSSLKQSKQTLEDRLKAKEKDYSSKIGELQLQLSKANKTVELNQKNITNLKREKQLLVSQANQLKCTLADERNEKENADGNDDIFEVEKIIDDKLVTERCYLVRWKGYNQANDSWEREQNLSCPKILKKYKQSKKKH